MSRLRVAAYLSLVLFLSLFTANLFAQDQQSPTPIEQLSAAHAARLQALQSHQQPSTSTSPQANALASPQVPAANLPLTNIQMFGATQLSLGNQGYFASVQSVQGDFNGDGKLDIASLVQITGYSNQFSNGSGYALAMFAGNGDGTFQAPVLTQIPAGNWGNPALLLAGDMDQSGNPDVVICWNYPASAVVYSGGSDGTFTQEGSTPTFSGSGFSFSGATLADVNGDGKLDLLMAPMYGDSQGSDYTYAFLGNGDGTFGAYTATQLPFVTSNATFIYSVFADVNGDGKLDLVSTDGYSVYVFLANSSSYSVYESPNQSQYFQSVTVADVNGDGKPDIVATDTLNDVAVVYLNGGNGTFSTSEEAKSFSTGYSSGPVSIGVADVNGDGKPDLLSVNGATADMTVLLGNGDGTFGLPSVGYDASFRPGGMPLIGDFNGDGKPDVVIGSANGNFGLGVIPSDNLTYLQGYGDGTFRAAQMSYTQSPDNVPNAMYSVNVATGDLNGDGKADVVVGNEGDNSAGVSVFLGRGDGSFQPGVNYGSGGGLAFVRLADVNGDGNLDIVASDRNYNNISIFLGNGDGTFAATPLTFDVSSLGMGSPSMLAVADLNGDGKPDVAVLLENGIAVLINDGTGTGNLLPPVAFPFWGTGSALAISNVNGSVNLVVGFNDHDGPNVIVIPAVTDSNDNFSFGHPKKHNLAHDIGRDAQLWDLAVGTFNTQDGILSVAATYINDSDNEKGGIVITQLSNCEQGAQCVTRLHSSQYRLFPSFSVGIRAADIDGDGNLDLVWTNFYDGTVAVAYGKGDGTFYDAVETAVGGFPAYLELADLNGDGALDVVAAVDRTAGMSVALNAGGTRTTLSAPGGATPGQTVTVTAKVAPDVRGVTGTPNGTVTFTDSLGLLVSPASTVSLTNGSASITFSPSASDTIVATYSGDAVPGDQNFVGPNFAPNFLAPSVSIVIGATPTISTAAITSITQTAAIGGGITSVPSNDTGVSVTGRGVCWSTTANPTTANNCASGTGTGAAFTSSITGLTAGTTYHVRAYATSVVGTAYGSDISFTTALAPSYSISASPSTATLTAGQSATFTITVTPEGGFNSPVTLSCGTLPKGVTCTFTPATVTPNGGPVTSTLVVQTTAATITTGQLRNPSMRLWASVYLLGFVLVGVRSRRRWALTILATALLLTMFSLGCGNSTTTSPNPNQSPTGSQSVTVNATASSGTQQMKLTINIQ